MRILLSGSLIAFILWVGLYPGGDISAATLEPPKNPNSAKGCAICHYRWIDTFFVEGRGTDLVPYQSEKVAAHPDMCFSCHDGSIKDSRARMMHGKGHKTNVKPPAEMKIPDIFPLDDGGRVQCATCHTAHGVESGPGVKETIFLRTSNINSAMCRMCHPDKDGGINAGNHSLGTSDQPVPRNLKMRWAHEGTGKNEMICETCHTAHGAPKEGYLVTGAGDSGLCLECHTNKGMFDPSGSRNANHAVNVKPQVAVITEVLYQKGARLGYDGVITCQTCHKIHNNAIVQPSLLIEDNRESDICLTCHTDKRRLEKTKHNLAVSAKTRMNLEGKTALESGMCSACHLPHKDALTPFKKTENTDRTTALCLGCHAKGMFAENEKLSGYSHPVDIALPAKTPSPGQNPIQGASRFPETLDLPLYNDFGVIDAKGKISCATCHDTHGGKVVQEMNPPEKPMAVPKNRLLRKTSPEICRSCHGDKFGIEDTRHDFAKVFPDSHPKLKEKAPDADLCRNCHRIHSRDAEGYVWNQIVATDAGNQVADMCGSCHGKDGLAKEMIPSKNSHPMNRSLPERMTDTGLPLFNAAGKPADKGILTCYTCHDPHQQTLVLSESGTPVYQNSQAVNRFLRNDIIPNSGLCVQCHKDKADVLNSDHNLGITAPDVRNTSGRTPYESGTCGACHIMHDSKAGVRLWAQPMGQGDAVMDRLCNSCHRENGAAGNKVPQVSSHPDTLIANRWTGPKNQPPAFPLYDKTTAKLVPSGNISCASCHNAHQWRPGGTAADAVNVNVEGDATTSFLRPHIPDRICKECHGPDGLFKYKYFHKADDRKP